jgi:hypothetical protein
MKIAVTSTGPTLDDNVEPRFGRCPYFISVQVVVFVLMCVRRMLLKSMNELLSI